MKEYFKQEQVRKSFDINLDSFSLRKCTRPTNLKNDCNEKENYYWQTIISAALIENHPLNANYLHEKLKDLSMSDIDADWTQFISQNYVNYYDREIKQDDENPTVGILLSTNKNETVVKYTLPEDNKTIFSSEYKLHMPTEQELISAVEEEKKNFELNEEN